MTDVQTYDFVVIGGGSAGYAGARTAVTLGLKTAVIDGADELGGLCILRGCMPSKTLIESANRNLAMRHAGSFGLHAHVGEPDIRSIRDRKRLLINDFASYRSGQLKDGRFDLIRGMGRIVSVTDDGVRLTAQLKNGDVQEVQARTVLVATGSEIVIPDLSGLQETGYWTSDTILDADELPDSFIVLGGGAIALEMAHYLDGVGRKVTVVQRSKHLLSNMDADIADVVRSAFEKRGIEVHCGTALKCFAMKDGLKQVTFAKDGELQTASAAEVLVALGRRPALDKVGLAETGIELQANGAVKALPTQQTSSPRIFAAGDVCGPLEVVHLAIQQGEVAAKNAASLLKGENPAHTMDYRCKLFGVFTQPQAAAVGLSESEAKARGLDFTAATYPFNDHGKSMVMNELDGFVKIIASRQDGKILGASVVGPEATELIHELAVAMHLRATVHDLATAPHYHPTLSEIWTYPAEELAESVPLVQPRPVVGA
jgi:pyruvate/2-oxoglutarate dehydrogenase complex dihydrolipoamide dehydrogenase (E3) component